MYNMNSFRKSLLAIAIPVSLQSLIQASLSMIDQFMIGQLGAEAVASVGIGSKGLFILLFVLSGIGGGASIYVSQYWGKGEKNKIAQVLGIALLSGGLVSMLFFLFSFFTPFHFIRLFSADRAVLDAGSAYLRLIAPGYFPLLLVIAWSSVLRSTGHTKLPLYAGFISVIINTVLNWIFIFGVAIVPAMGVEGAALATTLARCLEALILLVVVYGKKFPGAFSIKELLTISPDFVKSFAITSVPLVLTEFIWVLGDSAFSAIYGRIGTGELAAMTLTGPIQMISFGLMSGVSTAAAVIIGNELGGNNKDLARKYGRRFILLSISMSLIIGLVIVLAAPFYVSFFNVEESVAQLTIGILKLFSLVLWIKVCNMVMGNGILRSGGDTKFVMMMDTIGMWCIGVPLGILSAFVWNLPFPMVYLIVSAEEAVRMFFMMKRTGSGRWLNNLVENI